MKEIGRIATEEREQRTGKEREVMRENTGERKG